VSMYGLCCFRTSSSVAESIEAVETKGNLDLETTSGHVAGSASHYIMY